MLHTALKTYFPEACKTRYGSWVSAILDFPVSPRLLDLMNATFEEGGTIDSSVLRSLFGAYAQNKLKETGMASLPCWISLPADTAQQNLELYRDLPRSWWPEVATNGSPITLEVTGLNPPLIGNCVFMTHVDMVEYFVQDQILTFDPMRVFTSAIESLSDNWSAITDLQNLAMYVGCFENNLHIIEPCSSIRIRNMDYSVDPDEDLSASLQDRINCGMGFSHRHNGPTRDPNRESPDEFDRLFENDGTD